MTKQSKNCFKRVILLLIVLTSLLAGNSMAAQAASAKANALKAYKAFLSKSTIPAMTLTYKTKNCYFALAYMDNNTVPELIVEDSRDSFHMSGYATIYAYKGGKVKRVTGLQLDSGNITYYRKKGVYIDVALSTGVLSTMCYTIKNGSVSKMLYCKTTDPTGRRATTYSMYSGGRYKNITKAKYNSGIKKLTGSVKKSKLIFHKNTKANRSRYMK